MKKISIAATGIVILMSLKEGVGLVAGHHGEHSDKPLPDYMQVRLPFHPPTHPLTLFTPHNFTQKQLLHAIHTLRKRYRPLTHPPTHAITTQIRAKPFPWECSNCSLFDTDCFKKCKAERAGETVSDH